MKRIATVVLATIAFGLFAEEAAPLEKKKDSGTKWRVSAGYRVAPKVKTSARVNGSAILSGVAPAALERTPKASSSTTTKVTDLGATVTGTGADEVAASSGYTGASRYEFENGYIDMDDGAGIAGETQNWHFEDASAYDSTDKVIFGERSYSQTTVSRSRSETISISETGGASSLDTTMAELTDSTSEAAQGFELRIGRTIYEKGSFGVDIDIGYTYFDEIDCFSIGGALSSATSSRTRTTKTTTSETTVTKDESGKVYTVISQPEFTDLADIQNSDGTIGGAYHINGSLTQGYQIPVLTVTEDRFSVVIAKDQSATSTMTSKPTETVSSSVISKGNKAIDVKSEGTLSLQELRFGVQPYWRATEWFKVSLDAGVIATYSELDVSTAVNVGGMRYATYDESEDDWTISGFVGLGLTFTITEYIDIIAGGEVRVPSQDIDFDCGYASGSIEMPKWSGMVGVAIRF